MINDVLKDFLNLFVFVCLDDILILSKTLNEHVFHVRQLLQRLLENKLFVRAEKCESLAKSASFLGYINESERVKTDEAKVKDICKRPQPSNHKQLQNLLGFANFYRDLLWYFNSAGAPLTKLTSIKNQLNWTPDVEQAFAQSKALFASTAVLEYCKKSKLSFLGIKMYFE